MAEIILQFIFGVALYRLGEFSIWLLSFGLFKKSDSPGWIRLISLSIVGIAEIFAIIATYALLTDNN